MIGSFKVLLEIEKKKLKTKLFSLIQFIIFQGLWGGGDKRRKKEAEILARKAGLYLGWNMWEWRRHCLRTRMYAIHSYSLTIQCWDKNRSHCPSPCPWLQKVPWRSATQTCLDGTVRVSTGGADERGRSQGSRKVSWNKENLASVMARIPNENISRKGLVDSIKYWRVAKETEK